MSEIGIRSGKIAKGVYQCGEFVISRTATGHWWVYRGIGLSADVLAHHKPFNTHAEAYAWCRLPPGLRAAFAAHA